METESGAVKSARLVMTGRLTVDKAGELKSAFSAALGQGGRVELEMTGATEVDITFFQVLFAAHKAAVQSGASLVLPPTWPPAMEKALREAGLCKHAGLCANTPEPCLWTGGEL